MHARLQYLASVFSFVFKCCFYEISNSDTWKLVLVQGKYLSDFLNIIKTFPCVVDFVTLIQQTFNETRFLFRRQ